MTLSAKVGAFLGKKPKSEDATFGEPLNLEQIAVGYDSPSEPSAHNSSEATPSQESQMANETNPTQEKPTSILDLDFMAAPLAEIEMISAKTGGEPSPPPVTQDIESSPEPVSVIKTATEVSAPLPPVALDSPPMPVTPPAAAPSAVVETSVLPSPQAAPAAAVPTLATPVLLSPLPTPTPIPSPTPQITPPAPALASDKDTAIAQSLREDTENGICVFGRDGTIEEISPVIFDIIGFSETEKSSTKTYGDFLSLMASKANISPEKAEVLQNTEAAKMLQQVNSFEFKTYSWKTQLLTGKTLQFRNSYTPNGYLVTRIKDVTDQVERNRLLRVGLQIGTAGYWSYSFTTGRSVLSDYITEKLTDNELKRANENGFLSLIHTEDAPEVQRQFDKAVQEKSRMDCFFRLQSEKSGELHMRLVGEVESAPRTGRQIAFIAFINDVTEDKRQREELREAKELSQHKSDFLARMSHEIKTPLNAIVGMTDALRDEVESEEARETACFIADAAENLNTILSQTLEHERLSTTEIALDEDVVDIGDIARSVLAMWKKPCADKGLKLNLRLSPDLPTALRLDNSRFRQCLTNVISNAVKFTDAGHITLAVAPLNIGTPNAKLIVAVKDTGIGMTQKASENMFKPYHQADNTIQRRFGGSGLGMSITQRIVSAMNGTIKVKSEENEGTTIVLSLPLKLAEAVDFALASPLADIESPGSVVKQAPAPTTPAASPPPASDIAAPHALSAETFHKVPETTPTPSPQVKKQVELEPSDYSGFDVLVVEDNPINQAVVRKLLNKHINSMSFAFHGQEALDLLETQEYDVILMDIHMPVKDGIETTIEIRNSGKPWADTVIVALTADPDFQQKRVCRNIGMNDALSKPVKRQELLEVMQRVMDERNTQRATQGLTG